MKYQGASYVYILLISVLVLTACKKERDDVNTNLDDDMGSTQADSMQLIYFGGFSPEPVKGYFMITPAVVKEDTTTASGDPERFNYVRSDSLHNEVVPLLDAIPGRLLQENNSSYRDSLVADCGTMTVTAYINGQTYNWTFDDCTARLPNHARPFAERVRSAIRALTE